MKIKEIRINNFKRFTDLTITGIPETAKLVVLVGPNGCGKTSLFEAFNVWYQIKGFSMLGTHDYQYYIKKSNYNNIQDKTSVFFFDDINKIIKLIYYGSSLSKGQICRSFYFRSAYRNESNFVISNLSKQKNPINDMEINRKTLITTDAIVSENYHRLISSIISSLFIKENNDRTVEELRKELIEKIQISIHNVFEDLELSSLGEPLENGSFYFTKGNSKNFIYANLSAGEKSAFDLILDLIIKSSYFTDTVFCIDEPESHMHTILQSKLLKELYSLISKNSQLWISTHSMGMLKKAKELEEENPGTVVFLDFENRDFDNKVVMTPSRIDSTMWKRFLDLALGDLSKLIAPKIVVFCEGNTNGRKYKDFDAQIYTKIFNSKYPDVSFVSVGSCSEIENEENISMKIISQTLSNSKKIKLVDRDDMNDNEIEELKNQDIKVLSKRHIESYLLDDEILKLLCEKENKSDKYDEIISIKKAKLEDSISRGNPKDDIKSASGDIYVEIKKILQLSHSGNTKDAFFRDTLAPLITPETQVYKELEKDIFE
ncbi:MAG: AAA family ATPase [Elusimicrobia bacterium]|nr:AAA family ATPase [Elusimicrobiota bacterium]